MCSREWEASIQFLGAGVLPICEDLPYATEDCMGNGQLLLRWPDYTSRPKQ